MSTNNFSAKTPSNNSNHQTLFTTANAAAFWAGTATGAAMFCGPSAAAFRFNLNNNESDEDNQAAGNPNARDNIVNSQLMFEQEKLFEKLLTPSDVGKLNRLVIPKQHAEKYFPLGGGEALEKGLLLGFEDEVGKPWRFRYSYWNSSQSYVLTKGWSRFVKEKRLNAGDVVLFGRHRLDFGHLFIAWRRRNSGGGDGGGVCPCPSQHLGSSPSLSSAEKQTIISRNGNSKRLIRLFGVNLEWLEDESEPSTPEGSTAAHRQPYNQY